MLHLAYSNIRCSTVPLIKCLEKGFLDGNLIVVVVKKIPPSILPNPLEIKYTCPQHILKNAVYSFSLSIRI